MRILTDFNPTPETQEIIYNASDTLNTAGLLEKFDEGLLPDWSKRAWTYSEKMLGPIMTMMRRGVRIDLAKRDALVSNLRDRTRAISANFDALCEGLWNCTINPNSTPQLRSLFYEFLAVPELTKSKKGEVKISTDRATLEKIYSDYPRAKLFAAFLMRISDLDKQIEFLTKGLSSAGRFHTSYNISGTETFRLSSSEHPLRIGCVPETAEALTPTGWVPISSRPPIIAQWDAGQISFVPAQWQFQNYTGQVWEYSGRCVRGVFTPNHRVLRLIKGKKIATVPAITASAYKFLDVPTSGQLTTGTAQEENWIRKLVMLSADGNLTPQGTWRLKFKKERKARRAEAILNLPQQQRRSYGYYDYNPIQNEGFTKQFPDITKWDAAARQIFFDELKHWDAHIRGNSFIYYTTIKENAELVLTAAHLTNLSASILVNPTNSNQYGNTSTKPLYLVNISPKITNKLEGFRWKPTNFSGSVGCPTVPSSYWLVKMNGGIHVTGNSNQQNIPKSARPIFVADPGYTMFQADQQGAEARIVAYESGDEAYIKAVEGGDSHTMVAAMVFGFPPVREEAEKPFYRDYSYRDMAKRGAHGCLTADHEVLTPAGWVSIASKPAIIAGWSTTKASKFVQVQRWTEVEDTNWIEIEGPSISAKTTLCHRFVVNADGKFVVRQADALCKSDKIPYTGNWVGGTTFVPEARLVAAYQADGNLTAKGLIRFKFRRPRKIARMQELLKSYANQYTVATYNKDTVFFLNKPLSNKLSCWGKHAGPTLLTWDFDSLSFFADECMYWGGNTTGKTGRRAVSSMSLEHCRWLQTIFQLCGYGSKVIDNTGKTSTNFSGRRAHFVSQNNRHYASLNCATIFKTTNGATTKFYCPSVEGEYFWVRRNGHIFITANSNYYGKPFTLASNMKVEVALAEQFQAKYFKAFPGIAEWHAWKANKLRTDGWIENPFGFRRPFWGRRWDDATLREAIAYGPQSTVGILTNLALHRLWSELEGKPGAPVQILMNGHDAVIGQIRTDLLEEYLPKVLELLRIPFHITDIKGKRRPVLIPWDIEISAPAEQGGNWGKYDAEKNPGGLRKPK